MISMYHLIIFGLIVLFNLKSIHGNNKLSDGSNANLNDRSEEISISSNNNQDDGEAEEDSEWIVYEPEDFDKNELCMVLTCQREELCLVRNNNAICGNSNQLDDIDGKKRFHKSNNAQQQQQQQGDLRDDKQNRGDSLSFSPVAIDFKNAADNENQQQQWDQQKLRDKMTKYVHKLQEKKNKKTKRDEINKVTFGIQNGEKELSRMEPLENHGRHGSRMGTYQNCTVNELNSIKGRLFKWFSDIHSIQKNEPGYELPAHKVVCNEDVGFMFFLLDGDKDEKLNVDELFSIDNDPHEKCVKSFLDRCDTDSNDDLSLDEWCDCFHWADDDRHEPACHAALRKHDPHDPNSFFPNCDTEGYYKLDQCQKNQCWCVDKWGREFDHSRTNGGSANCQKYVL